MNLNMSNLSLNKENMNSKWNCTVFVIQRKSWVNAHEMEDIVDCGDLFIQPQHGTSSVPRQTRFQELIPRKEFPFSISIVCSPAFSGI